MDSERLNILNENFKDFCLIIKENKQKLLPELCKIDFFSEYLVEEEEIVSIYQNVIQIYQNISI